MATVAPTTAGVVQVVEWGEHDHAVCAAAIVGGTFVRRDSSGNWVQALADTAPHVGGARLALKSAAAGEPLTAMRTGVVAGFTVSQAMEAALYVSDTGTLADAAGTVSTQVGRVVAGRSNLIGAAVDKLIKIVCPL